MTDPLDDDLLELATPYALHSLSDAELADVDRRVAEASPDVAEAFFAEVSAIHETMAIVSAVTSAEPPPELRDALLAAIAADPVRALPERTKAKPRRRGIYLAAAAAVVIGVGAAVGVGIGLRPSPTIAEQVIAAPDHQTVKGSIPTGGIATLVYSREKNAGVLTMTDVAPPSEGTVYQMWLVPADGSPKSAGVMGPAAVSPTTTAVLPDLTGSTALAFTVEPGDGSAQPTTTPFAVLSLST